MSARQQPVAKLEQSTGVSSRGEAEQVEGWSGAMDTGPKATVDEKNALPDLRARVKGA